MGFVSSGPVPMRSNSASKHCPNQIHSGFWRAISILFRPNFTRLAFGARPHGPSHSPKVAESRIYGKTRPSRNDEGDPTRWNYFPSALELRVGWAGATLAGKVPAKETAPVSRR